MVRETYIFWTSLMATIYCRSLSYMLLNLFWPSHASVLLQIRQLLHCRFRQTLNIVCLYVIRSSLFPVCLHKTLLGFLNYLSFASFLFTPFADFPVWSSIFNFIIARSLLSEGQFNISYIPSSCPESTDQLGLGTKQYIFVKSFSLYFLFNKERNNEHD